MIYKYTIPTIYTVLCTLIDDVHGIWVFSFGKCFASRSIYVNIFSESNMSAINVILHVNLNLRVLFRFYSFARNRKKRFIIAKNNLNLSIFLQ